MSPGKSPRQLWGTGGQGESWVWESSLWSCQDHGSGVDGVFRLLFRREGGPQVCRLNLRGPQEGVCFASPFRQPRWWPPGSLPERFQPKA